MCILNCQYEHIFLMLELTLLNLLKCVYLYTVCLVRATVDGLTSLRSVVKCCQLKGLSCTIRRLLISGDPKRQRSLRERQYL